MDNNEDGFDENGLEDITLSQVGLATSSDNNPSTYGPVRKSSSFGYNIGSSLFGGSPSPEFPGGHQSKEDNSATLSSSSSGGLLQRGSSLLNNSLFGDTNFLSGSGMNSRDSSTSYEDQLNSISQLSDNFFSSNKGYARDENAANSFAIMYQSASNANLVHEQEENSIPMDGYTTTGIPQYQDLSSKVTRARCIIKSGGMLDAKDIKGVRTEIEMDEHLVELDELCGRYETDEMKGLDNDLANIKLEQDGPNKCTPVKKKSWVIVFMLSLTEGFVPLLWIGVVLCFISYGILTAKENHNETYDEYLYIGIVLVLVILMSAIFSFFQKWKRQRLMDNFETMTAHHAFVIRERKLKKIPAEQLVVGDLVELAYGDRVPADIRLTLVKGFKVDNSPLTGETTPLVRHTYSTDDNPLLTSNLVFSSTIIVEGHAKGIVIGTGDNTVIGRIARIISTTAPKKSPIALEIERFVKIITVISLVLAIFLLTLSLGFKLDWVESILFFIAILLANVPEGLMMTVTLSLTLTAHRLANKKVLVKDLEVVETLGCTSCICADKTGTITQGKMAVNHLWYNLSTKSIDPALDMIDLKSATFLTLCKISILCNDAQFVGMPDPSDAKSWECIADGKPLDNSLLKYFHTVVDSFAIRNDNELKYEIPFSSAKKYGAKIYLDKSKPEQVNTLYVKGACERIIAMCSSFLKHGSTIPITRTIKREVKKVCAELGNEGERLIAVAIKMLDGEKYPVGFDFENTDLDLHGLCFVGLISLIDPPKLGVKSAVQTARNAGIRVIMFTGDHPMTASCIAKNVGIITKKTRDDLVNKYEELFEEQNISKGELDLMDLARIIKGRELDTMDRIELQDIIQKHDEIIFTRISPDQKLVIVETLQSLGYIVAVTGDGVNDSPALRSANIGVAMGLTGTEVAKEAADIVILDDDFSSIVIGITEGRLIYDNLKKSIAYTLSSNVPEISPFLSFVFLGIPLPLSIILVLIIDLGTDMYPAIALAYEAPESDMMSRKPRSIGRYNKDYLVTGVLIANSYFLIGVIQALAGFFCYFAVFADNGFLPADLINSREGFDDREGSVTDSYGQMWGYQERKNVQAQANSSFFIAILIVQCADLIICKTRRLSILQQGMRNYHVLLAMFLQLALGAFLCYTPGVNAAFKIAKLNVVYWPLSLPFAFLIIAFDETRKFLIRKYPGGWADRELYY